jgi:hypothetical protein
MLHVPYGVPLYPGDLTIHRRHLIAAARFGVGVFTLLRYKRGARVAHAYN